MIQSPYQVYAFEFYAKSLKTNSDLGEIKLEVQLFHLPPAIVEARKPQPIASPSLWVMHSKSRVSHETLDTEEKLDEDPFKLDMRSLSNIKESESSQDVPGKEDNDNGSEFWNEDSKIVSKPPVKQVNPPDDGITTNDGDGNSEELGEEANVRRSLRMFPQDPTGQPYHKAKKKKKEEEEQEQSNITIVDQNQKPAEKSPSPCVPKPENVEPKEKAQEERQEEETIEDNVDDTAPQSQATLETEATNKMGKVSEKKQTVFNSDYFESGVTLMLPMMPFSMIHNLQRLPLKVRAFSDEFSMSAYAYLDLWPLFECVLRAERGPPTPVTSSNHLKLVASGDFNANISCSVRLYAFGQKTVLKVSAPGNPNRRMNHIREEAIPEFRECDTDIQTAPPQISGPEHISKRTPQLPVDGEILEDYPPKEKNQRLYIEEDLVFCPNQRIIAPKPSDTYETMRWKIDRMLGLTNVTTKEQGQPEKTSKNEGKSNLNKWYKKKKVQLEKDIKESQKKKRDTRRVLRKILQGMNEPDPINLELRISELSDEDKPGVNPENGGALQKKSDDEQQKDVQQKPGEGDGEEVNNTAKRLYDEIQRQQREEKMIKHYKRLFRKMLRRLESEKGVWSEELRRREKMRKGMKDLLAELETYPSESVERTYVEVLKARSRADGRKVWEVDSWPDIPEEREEAEEEDLDEEEEEEEQLSATNQESGDF